MDKFLALSVMLLWGGWGLLDKKASETLSVAEIEVYKTLIYLLALPFLFNIISKTGKLELSKQGIVLSMLSGAACLIAELLFIYLIKYNPAGWVVSITASYPIITIVFSMFLFGEIVSTKQLVGIISICIGLYLTY